MAFSIGSPLGLAGVGAMTGGWSEIYRAMRPKGSMQGYAPLPFDQGANRAVDNNRIAQEFRAVTGKDPSPSEIENFARFIKNGDLEYGDIGQILQGSPERSEQRLDRKSTRL